MVRASLSVWQGFLKEDGRGLAWDGMSRRERGRRPEYIGHIGPAPFISGGGGYNKRGAK